MFNQQNFNKLENWINNHNFVLKELYSKDISDLNSSRQALLKIMLFSNKLITATDINEQISKFLRNDVGEGIFLLSDFLQLDSLEDKTYYLLSRINNIEKKERTALIDGLFMYAVQEQDIPMASLLYLNIDKNDKFKNDYLEFLNFEQNIDGSIGIINPLKENLASPEEMEDWILYNSLFIYAALPIASDEFVRR